MSLFDKFKKSRKSETAITWPAAIGAAASGTVVPMEAIPDEVFSAGVLGTCIGIEPSEGKIYAPVDGKISQLADTLHAIGLETAGGIEVLIHVGIDTVDMNGDGFRGAVKEGAFVKAGDLLLTVDLDKIRAAEHAATVITVVTNSDDFSAVIPAASGEVSASDMLLQVNK